VSISKFILSIFITWLFLGCQTVQIEQENNSSTPISLGTSSRIEDNSTDIEPTPIVENNSTESISTQEIEQNIT